MMHNHARPASEQQDRAQTAKPRRFFSDDLLNGNDRIEIEHKGEIYTLRLTRRDKLILTK
jgi:hemin uptake protein HemP